MKVNNRQAVRETAWHMYKAETKRNLLSIAAIGMAAFLIAVMTAIGSSYWHTLTERQLRIQGVDCDIELSEPREDQVETVCAMDKVRYAGVSVACASVELYKDQAIDYAKLYWSDEVCWEKQTIPALESYTGQYPEKENELMLSETLLNAMHIDSYEIGMKLPLRYTIMVTTDREIKLEQEFVLSGWYKDYSGEEKGYVSKAFYDSTGVQQTDFGLGSLKISLVNPLYFPKDIAEMNEAIGITGGQRIVADDYAVPHFCQVMLALTGLFGMVLVSAYLFIYNTMYISISRNIRCYGQLKTIGMTSVQLKGIVRCQAFFNAAAGILAGLAGAAFVSRSAVPKILVMVNGAYEESQVIPVDLWAFLAAGVFALSVNMISCQKPAKTAGSCSPVEAMCYLPGTTKSGLHSVSKGVQHRTQSGAAAATDSGKKREKSSLPDMALQNIFRDKKQAAVILLSFSVALSVFFTVNVVIWGNDAKHILNEISGYDMCCINQTMPKNKKQIFTEEKIAQLKAVEGVKTIRQVTSASASVPYQEDTFGEVYRAWYASRYSPGNYEEDIEKYKNNTDSSWAQTFFGTRLVGIGREGFERLNESVGNTLDQEAFENGETAVALEFPFLPGDYGMAGKTVRFQLPEGLHPDETYSIRIAAVSKETVNYFGAGATPFLVVSENLMQQLFEETYTELIEIDYEEPYSTETEAAVKDVFADEKKATFNSRLERYESMLESETQIKILGYSIGFMIAVLALFNYVNMMAAAVQNRSREFAVLESIGMTRKQQRKMLCLEGAGYGLASVVCSLVIGGICSYAVFGGLTSYSISYEVPWGSMLALYAGAAGICMAVPVILWRMMQRGSIIDRLREAEPMT